MHLEACCGDTRSEIIDVEVKGAGDVVVTTANVFYVALVNRPLCSQTYKLWPCIPMSYKMKAYMYAQWNLPDMSTAGPKNIFFLIS